MVKENGTQVFTSLEEVAEYLNSEGLKGKTISHEENLGNNSQENYEAIELTNCEQPEVEEQEIAYSSTITQQQFVFENNQKVFPFPIWLVRIFCCGRRKQLK